MRGPLTVRVLIGGGLLGAFAPPATAFDYWKPATASCATAGSRSRRRPPELSPHLYSSPG